MPFTGGDHMSEQGSDPSNAEPLRRQRTLSRRDSERGAGPDGPQTEAVTAENQVPMPSNDAAEVGALHVRIIALENLVISLLATASDRQLEQAGEMARYISPRPGATHHPLTTYAAGRALDRSRDGRMLFPSHVLISRCHANTTPTAVITSRRCRSRCGTGPPTRAVYLVRLIDLDHPAGGDCEVVELQPARVNNLNVLTIGDRVLLEPAIQSLNHYCARAVPSGFRYLATGSLINNGQSPEAATTGNVLDPLMAVLLMLNTVGLSARRSG
jgi:hypothetical protein